MSPSSWVVGQQWHVISGGNRGQWACRWQKVVDESNSIASKGFTVTFYCELLFTPCQQMDLQMCVWFNNLTKGQIWRIWPHNQQSNTVADQISAVPNIKQGEICLSAISIHCNCWVQCTLGRLHFCKLIEEWDTLQPNWLNPVQKLAPLQFRSFCGHYKPVSNTHSAFIWRECKSEWEQHDAVNILQRSSITVKWHPL